MKRALICAAVSVWLAAVLDAQRPNPCTLVTKADVQQAVGATVADPKPTPGNAAVCDFRVGDFGAVTFMVQHLGPGDSPDRTIAGLRKRNIPVTETKGIWKRGFFASHGYGMTQLNAYKGSNCVILTLRIPGAGEDKQKAIAGELMPKALSKL